MPERIGFALVYVVSAAISTAAALAVFRRRQVRGGRPLGFMLLAAALWAACDAVELQLVTVEGKRFISQVQYLGVISCVPFFFHASMELARLESRITRTVLAGVWGVPIISLVMAWTSHWHQLLWTGIDLPSGDSPFAIYRYGPWFWVLAAQNYALTAVNTVVLLWGASRVGKGFRTPMLAVVVAMVISWTGNAMYIFKLGPWPGVNLLTMSLGLSGSVLAWAVVREGLLDLLPRAREALVEAITDGVAILDRDGRVSFANQAAEVHLGARSGQTRLADGRLDLGGADGRWRGEFDVPSGGHTRWFDVRIDPVVDRWGEVAGRLVVTRDITARKVLERERERLIGELKDALRDVRALEELLPICASCKKVRDDKGYWSQIDDYLRTRSGVEFTHGICPDCYEKLYGEHRAPDGGGARWGGG